MANYTLAKTELWQGRESEEQLYLHEKVKFVDLESPELQLQERTVAILGYACDVGVSRNKGRAGAVDGPDAFRRQFSKLPNHLHYNTGLVDAGNIECRDNQLEETQELLAEKITSLLRKRVFPIVIGGGHDVAYGHFKGLLGYTGTKRTIGIINLDAHLDLRSNENGNHSGSPFYQIGMESREQNFPFKYMCMGVRSDSNDRSLFKTATSLRVEIIPREVFSIHRREVVISQLQKFINTTDHLYLTIDLDGFSSAFAPGVSAASPVGFSHDIVMEVLKTIISSGK
ncbi:MAG: formimidoylglutamase, partial [Flavobacteriaceae bacterium]|nr:formimidoylglutamase [Flavobacteriaceae bacterium]